MTDEELARIKPGQIIRDADGRKFIVKNIRKERAMYEVNDVDAEVAKLERQLNDLEKTLNDAVASVAASPSFEDSIRKAKTIEDLTEARRSASPEAFRAWQNEAITKSTAGEPLGVEGQRKAKQRWDKLVGQIARDSKLSRTAAMSKARQEFPDEFAKFQASAVQ